MKKQKQYPYQDKDLKNMQGESWKDIPGFEGYYKVSNLGRVKSLDRIVPHSRCGTQFVAGRILSQHIKKHRNYYTKDHVVILQATLMLENEPYEYSVRRLVYGAFMNKAVLRGDKRMVVSKDGDGYNCYAKNLRLITNSEKQKMVIQRKRVFNSLAWLDHRTFKPTYSLWKPVHRCSLKGKILATYPSIVQAAKDGFNEKLIIEAAKGRIKQYRGHKWRYASRKVLKPLIDVQKK